MPAVKVDIRTNESHLREVAAKAQAHKILLAAGFAVLAVESRKNRHTLLVEDEQGAQRRLWFKLGWNPETHGTSAVQITMLKSQPGEAAPSTWTNEKVLQAVAAKFERAAADGVTDLFLFSLSADNSTPIAARLMPIATCALAFKECLAVDAPMARKGASPSFWLKGATLPQQALADVVTRHCPVNLLEATRSLAVKDSVDDLLENDDLHAVTDERGPGRVLALMTRYRRDSGVRRHVLEWANGKCELCGELGFRRLDGSAYLEAHHVISLAADGPDAESNVVGLCAAHHREAHYGERWEALAQQMLSIARARPKALYKAPSQPRGSATDGMKPA